MKIRSVSISEIKTGMRCPLKHHYSYHQKLVGIRKSPAMSLGSFIHKLAELHYGTDLPPVVRPPDSKKQSELDTATTYEGATEAYRDVLSNMSLSDEDCLEELDRALRVWEAYLRAVEYPDSKLTPVVVEHEFRVPLKGSNIQVHGFVDLIAQDKQGRYFMVEHKTGKQDTIAPILQIDPQMSCYLYVVLKDFKQLATGVYNYIKTGPPPEPTLLKSGKLSTAKTPVTDKATYTAAVKSAGLDLADYGTHIATLPDNITNTRLTITRNKSSLQNFVMELAHQVDYLNKFSGKFRNPTKDCHWDCPYFDLCKIEMHGGNSDYIRENDFTIKED